MVRLFCALFALVCRFAEQVEQLQDKAVWRKVAQILEKEKRGIGNQYLPEGTLPDAKNRIKIRKSRRAKMFRFFAPCLPLCAALQNRWSSCRARQFGANLPRFWAKKKKEVFGASICKGGL